MNFYAYEGNYKLGEEPLGTSGKMIIRDLKTSNGALRRCSRIFGSNFRLYSFSNFYNNATFREIRHPAGVQ